MIKQRIVTDCWTVNPKAAEDDEFEPSTVNDSKYFKDPEFQLGPGQLDNVCQGCWHALV